MTVTIRTEDHRRRMKYPWDDPRCNIQCYTKMFIHTTRIFARKLELYDR